MKTENKKETANDEATKREFLQKLRSDFKPEQLISGINIHSRQEAIERGVEIINCVFKKMASRGINLEEIEPGHGIGHITRDYLNGLILISELNADPRELFIGFIAGALHEIGVTKVKRYAESARDIRHAEEGAILMDSIMTDPSFYPAISAEERICICYSIAAHTHYLKAADVTCADGVVRKIEPYLDTYPDGSPILMVCIARWTDRLDVNGAAFVGRHFLTLVQAHSDYDGKNFYPVTFASHMKPLLRNAEEIKAGGGSQTMLEHLKMFASSQNNGSPYGKYDFGYMVELRDAQTARLNRVINAVVEKNLSFNPTQEELVLAAWTAFLCSNIEPSKKAEFAAIQLKEEFKKLDKNIRTAWLNGFVADMKEYSEWSDWAIKMAKKIPTEWLCVSGKNIIAAIEPRWFWEKIIKEI